MNQINFLFSPAAQALGHTILYSIGQAFIVFLCLRIVLKLIPNASSRIKYSLSYIGYLGLALLFVITFIRQFYIAQSETFYQQISGNYSFINTPFEQNSTSISSIFSLSFLNEYLPWFVGFYLLGIFWYSLRLSINFFQTNQLKKKEIFELDSDWQAHIIQLSKRMNITKPLKTYFSGLVNTPVMIGFLKPVILLPLALMNHLSPQQFEAILLHELAHIRRNDYVLNILQSVFDAILFFNPFAWWITNKIREERENCCDEMVLQLSDPYHYARALLALEEPMKYSPLIMTAIGKRSQLFHRIKKIMEMKNNPLNARQKFITLLILVMATFSVSWLSPSENKVVSNDHQKMIVKESQASMTSFSTFFNFKSLMDSVPKEIAPLPPLPPQPPVAIKENGVHPLHPLPPLPPMPPNPPIAPLPPQPPLPPLGKLNDSLPLTTDYFNSKEWEQQQEAIKKSTDEMQKYFQSDAWKKQQNLMQENALAMKKYFNSPEWKKQQDLIKKNAEDIESHFNSTEWKKQIELMKKNQDFNNKEWKNQVELMKKNGQEMKKYFNSPDWEKQQNIMKKSGEEMKKYFNSDEWKKQQELIKKNASKVQEYFNSPEWKKQQDQIQHATDSLTSFFKSNT